MKYFLIVLCFGCSIESNNTFQPSANTCYIPDDQQQTINGQFPTKPILLGLSKTTTAFTQDEVNSIQAAVQVWNDFFFKIKKFNVFTLNTNVPTNEDQQYINQPFLCRTDIVNNNKEFSGYVLIYKNQKNWSTLTDSSLDNKLGITVPCIKLNDTSAVFVNAAVLLNFQDFFSSTNGGGDLQSTVTHELGHVLGLGHSCEVGGKNNYPDCNNSNINPSYLSAIMFPMFSINEIRRSLNNNDQTRALCLY